MDKRRLIVIEEELIVLDRFRALIVATGEVIPTFAGGIGAAAFFI